jgi:phosphate:Na+ symporter
MVIGANVGTTTTAVLATLDATSNAKRTAAAHVVFNIVTGFVALFLLPFMLNNLKIIRQVVGLNDEPGVMLALFHTTFNMLGVVLFFPFTNRLVQFLGSLFRSVEEDEGRTQYLDNTLLSTPVLAIQALAKELGRIGGIAQRMAKGAISSEGIPGPRLKTDKVILDRLVDASADFSNQVQRTHLSPELDDLLPSAMRISGYYTAIAELATEIAADKSSLKPLEMPELQEELSHFKSRVVKLLKMSDTQKEDFSLEESADLFKTLQKDYQQLKSNLLRAGTKGQPSFSILHKKRCDKQPGIGSLMIPSCIQRVYCTKKARTGTDAGLFPNGYICWTVTLFAFF